MTESTTGFYDHPDDAHDRYDAYDDEDIGHWNEPDCGRCGPWCDEWGGDGLCMLQIRAQGNEGADYDRQCVQENILCPVCGKTLTQYAIPTDTLWVWPGNFYGPMIGLGVYGPLDVPKSEMHRWQMGNGTLCHIWTGDPETGQQLILLTLGVRDASKD